MLYEAIVTDKYPPWELNRFNKCHPTGMYKFVGGVFISGYQNYYNKISNSGSTAPSLFMFMEDETNIGSRRWFKCENSR